MATFVVYYFCSMYSATFDLLLAACLYYLHLLGTQDVSGMCGKWKGDFLKMYWWNWDCIKLTRIMLHYGRVAESTEEVSNLRPPRLIREDGIIRPYNRVEAEGYDLFEVCFAL